MGSAAELRESFLAMRERGAVPSGAVPRLSLIEAKPAGLVKIPSEPVRYLEGESGKERRAALIAELAEREGWTVTRYESTDEPHGVSHDDGRSIHVSSRWNASDRAELSIGAPKGSADGWSWHHELEQRATGAGGAKTISVGLGRAVHDLLADIDRRLLGPYASVWGDVCAAAAQHDREVREAAALALELSEVARGRKPGRLEPSGAQRVETHVYFPGGGVEVYPGRNGAAPTVRFDHISASVEQAGEIARILGENVS